MKLFPLVIVGVFSLMSVGTPLAAGTKPLSGPNLSLTGGECTSLGGKTYPDQDCNSGTACRTIDQNGKIHRVCTTKLVSKNPGLLKGLKPGANAAASTPKASMSTGGGLNLTGGECTSLGGTIQDDPQCNGGKLCKTIDQNGNQSRVCINELKVKTSKQTGAAKPSSTAKKN